MKYFSTLIFLIFQALVFSQTPSKTSKYAGLYGYGDNIEKGPIGSLILYPETDTTLLFNLSLNRGAPSYNMGDAYGRIIIRDDTGYYSRIDNKWQYNCQLKFVFEKKKITIYYVDVKFDECGFGAHVYPHGEYPKVNSNEYKYFENGEGKKIPFNAETLREWEAN